MGGAAIDEKWGSSALETRCETLPLTPFQSRIAAMLAKNRSEESYLAGGAALHFLPNSLRYSLDLDYFHDSEERVASSFKADQLLLKQNKISCSVEIAQPGYIRCQVSAGKDVTKIEWAQDSSWRFLPPLFAKSLGYVLNPIDLAINKILALAGRDEARDYLDVHSTHQNILPFGAQCWAACGKDPGFNPTSLLEILRRRGKYHEEDFKRLNLVKIVDLHEMKQAWLVMLSEAEEFVRLAPPEDLGCLYYSKKKKQFFQPVSFIKDNDRFVHFGAPGGVLPVFRENL